MVLFRAHFKGSGVAKSKIGFTELLGKRFSIFVTLCKQEVLSTISQVILLSELAQYLVNGKDPKQGLHKAVPN